MIWAWLISWILEERSHADFSINRIADAINFPGPDIEGLGALFDDPGQSVLAYCRTGTRCANLWVTSQSGDAQAAAVQTAREIGFDLSLVRA